NGVCTLQNPLQPLFRPLYLHHCLTIEAVVLISIGTDEHPNAFYTMEEKMITFNDIPEAMNYLIEKMNDLEELIRTSADTQPDKNIWFNLEELCDYLPDRPARQTVYSWVNQKKIPFHKKGKKLQFLKCEIDEWLHTDLVQQ
ncbi:MAG: helix-turn-helix domain-containing protein, partial [Proteiniphilum sp.]|nr:helix-turn-helix domain-containing protein [Proteiniphilum sp.]